MKALKYGDPTSTSEHISSVPDPEFTLMMSLPVSIMGL